MHDFNWGLSLFIVGLIGHLIMRRSMDIGKAIGSFLFGQSGLAEAGGEGEGEIKFDAKQQAHIDKLIGAKAAEYHSKLTPLQTQLNELSKFKTEYEKSLETKNQEDLIKAKKYEEAEGHYKKQIGDLSGKLTAHQQEIQDLKITHAVSNEVNRQNGFIEETIALVKGQTVIDNNGQVVIKSKDANGADILMPVADGIKKFLTERPHLVRSTHKGGSGSSGAGDGGAGQGGGGNGQGETLESLNAQMATAMRGTDIKLRSVLRGKIQAAMSAKGVHR